MAMMFPKNIKIDGVSLERMGSPTHWFHYASILYRTKEQFDTDLEKVKRVLGTGDYIKTNEYPDGTLRTRGYFL